MRATQSTTHLMGGVSERPAEMRMPGQMVEQVNGLSHPTQGLLKRPPSEHVSKLHPGPASVNTMFVHEADKDLTEKFKVIILNDTIKVFNAVSGEEYPVTMMGDAAAYLVGGEYRMATAGNTTVVTNKNVEVKTLTKQAPTRGHEALVFIRQGDYSTYYTIRLNGINAYLKTADGLSPQARDSIDTQAIAAALEAELLKVLGANASQWQIVRYGGTLHIRRVDGADFNLEVTDGLADKGMYSLKRTVQRFEDLPLRAPEGYVVQVVGDPGNNKDDYYVVYDASESTDLQGVWRECVEPGSLVALDATTMPHQLVLKGEFVGRTRAGDPLTGQLFTKEGEWTVVGGGGWDTGPGDLPGTTKPINQSDDAILQDHNEWVEQTLPTLASEYESARVYFDADTSLVQQGVIVSVHIEKNGVEVALRKYVAGWTKRDQWLPIPGPFNPGVDKLRMILRYSTKETPEHHKATINARNNSTATLSALDSGDAFASRPVIRFPGGLSIRVLLNVILVIPAYRVIPKGFQIKLYKHSQGPSTQGVLVYTYTAQASTLGYLVAQDIAVNYNGGGGLTASLTDTPGEVSFAHPGVGALAHVGWVSVGEGWSTSTMVHLPDLDMVTNEHVGRVCRNITDGSTGTILANTEDTIVVDALTAGGDNKFQKGDLITIEGEGTYFTFSAMPWREREVGSLAVNPFPSFVGKTISEVFFFQNRLGLVRPGGVVLSAAGDLLNFFRQTATDLRSDDVIDAEVALTVATNFHSAVEWNGQMYLLSDNAIVQMSGDPMVTPTTIRFDPLGVYPNTKDTRPAPAGLGLFLPRAKTAGAQITELRQSDGSPQGFEVTREVPSYINGKPISMAADEPLGVLAVVTDAQPGNQMYVYVWKDGERGREVASWSRWEFPEGTTNVAITIIEGYLWIVSIRSDGVYLDKLDLAAIIDRF